MSNIDLQAGLRDHLWMHMASHDHLFTGGRTPVILSLIHISEPTRLL